MGISKSLGTHILENHLDNWFELFFGRALDQMGQKFPSLTKNGSFWPNLAVFWPKIHYDHYNYPQFWTVFNVIWWKHPGHQK